MSESADDLEFLGRACDLAEASVRDGGGPFGAVVVKDGEVIATGTNSVTRDDDPTAHAEITALRDAGRVLGTHDLQGCIVYASCRPCPMCMAAAWWARADRIVYAATSDAAAAVGFDDAVFWDGVRDVALAPVAAEHVDHPRSSAPFEAWKSHASREEY